MTNEIKEEELAPNGLPWVRTRLPDQKRYYVHTNIRRDRGNKSGFTPNNKNNTSTAPT